MDNILEADQGKVFAYKDENGAEIVLGTVLCLGKNDDGSRYYQIDDPNSTNNSENNDIVVDNSTGDVVE